MGLHERAAEIYSRPLTLAADDIPSIIDVEKAFDDAVEWLHGNRLFSSAMLTEEPVRNLIDKTSSYLYNGIDAGLEQYAPSELMVARLKESASIFSGFKTLHEMNEAAAMLLDEKGYIKSFERFSKDVQTINDKYNKSYLRSEYEFAIASSQMAGKWEDLQDDDNGRYLLQYRTMEDDKVRADHIKLNDITLAPSDPFWDKYYPPNGWGCRCTVVKVRAEKYPATNSEDAMTAGAQATEGKYADMFRFNSGKQKTVYPAHNSYTISKCSTCKKNGLELAAKIPSNELCAACPIIRKCVGDKTKSQAAIRRTHYKYKMEVLTKSKYKIKIDGSFKTVEFTNKANSHIYNDIEQGRTRFLRYDDLLELDNIIKCAEYISTSNGLSHERLKDNIKRFHYLKANIRGRSVYINIGETEYMKPTGQIDKRRIVYSVTDHIWNNK